MYFNNKNNYFHGIMFHHFHDDKRHLKGQGSISKDGLLNLIKFIGRKNILNADDFLKRYKEKKLKKNHVCFTFDDCLKSQFDIAFPVMEELNIKGFFFVYSSALKNISSLFEVYRHFRMNFYSDIEVFYEEFYNHFRAKLNNFNLAFSLI